MEFSTLFPFIKPNAPTSIYTHTSVNHPHYLCELAPCQNPRLPLLLEVYMSFVDNLLKIRVDALCNLNIHAHTHISIFIIILFIYLYIYIYRERERKRERGIKRERDKEREMRVYVCVRVCSSVCL